MPPVLPFLLLLIALPSAHAQAYKCADANGKIQYSDRPCTGVTRSTVTTYGPSTPASNPAKGDPADDPLVAKCVDYLRGSRAWVDRESLRVEGARYEWVGVRDIGARRMLHVVINARNEYGGYGGPREYQCLIRGDNENIHTGAYELVKMK